MSIRELMSWRDVVHCVVGALVLTIVVCGGAYVSAGGPMPSMNDFASAAASKPLHAEQLTMPVRHVAPAAPTPVVAAVAAWPKAYHVLPGDSLSLIAQKVYHNPKAWTVIYWANKYEIRYANYINVGQNLTLPALPTVLPAGPRVLAPPPPPRIITLASSVHTAAPLKTAPAPQVAVAHYSGSGAMQSCIIARESGGNPNIWNASGHWGLYQFSLGTWVAHGGSAASFGNASVAEQNQIYYNTVAADGYSDWAPYDGC